MSTGNGADFEIFEFIDSKMFVPQQEGGFEYYRAGSLFVHVCVTDSGPDGLAERIGTTAHPVEGVVCLYAADPWGNVVEVLGASFGRMATLTSKGKRKFGTVTTLLLLDVDENGSSEYAG